ncbi:MAG: hypothetical protein IPN15_17110 [Saprospiraceae bacterium]|nr:hypothetical protein [Candidatus Vicinibacter affinis]
MTAWKTMNRGPGHLTLKILQAGSKRCHGDIETMANGENDGEDGGSIVYSKVGLKTTRLNKDILNWKKSPEYEAYNDQIPLECIVEKGMVDIKKNWLLRIGSRKLLAEVA